MSLLTRNSVVTQSKWLSACNDVEANTVMAAAIVQQSRLEGAIKLIHTYSRCQLLSSPDLEVCNELTILEIVLVLAL